MQLRKGWGGEKGWGGWGKRWAFTVQLSLQCNVFSRTVMVHAITMGRDTVDTKAVVVYVKTLFENKKPLS